MTTAIEVYQDKEFGQIRTVMVENQPWFVGKDVASALQYKDAINALKSHVDADDKMRWRIATPSRGAQRMTIINESGLYALIFGSKLESAKRFKRWVTAEVLPAIRKTGTYSAKQESAMLPLPQQQEQKLTEGDERILAYNRGIVLGVLRCELEEDSALEIYERLSIRGKSTVMKLLFGEVCHA